MTDPPDRGATTRRVGLPRPMVFQQPSALRLGLGAVAHPFRHSQHLRKLTEDWEQREEELGAEVAEAKLMG